MNNEPKEGPKAFFIPDEEILKQFKAKEEARKFSTLEESTNTKSAGSELFGVLFYNIQTLIMLVLAGYVLTIFLLHDTDLGFTLGWTLLSVGPFLILYTPFWIFYTLWRFARWTKD